MPEQRRPADESPRPGFPADPGPAPSAAIRPVADGVEHPLDPQVVLAWRLGSAISASIFSGMALIASIALMWRAEVFFRLFPLVVWVVFSGTLAALAFFWPGLRYRHTSYRVDEHGMRIRRGVWWRSEISLPRSRVQHTDVSQGPIERALGLATLIVHTAGTQHASVLLGGLTAATAFRIRDYLIDGGAGDGL